MIEFLYFDAGFTLIVPTPGVGYWYARAAALHGVDVTPAALDAAFPDAWKAIRAEYAGSRPLPYGGTPEEALEFWSQVVRGTFTRAGSTAPADPEFFREVFDEFARGHCWRVYDDVAEALKLARDGGVRCGILSNWDVRLRPVLEELGLARLVDVVVISADVGAEKPNPAIYAAAATAAGVSDPGRLALIGDEPEADGHGPLAAGWKQCLVWRRNDRFPPRGLRAAPTLVDAVREVLDR